MDKKLYNEREALINRMGKVGYSRDAAERTYHFYERNFELDTLFDVIEEKERATTSLADCE